MEQDSIWRGLSYTPPEFYCTSCGKLQGTPYESGLRSVARGNFLPRLPIDWLKAQQFINHSPLDCEIRGGGPELIVVDHDADSDILIWESDNLRHLTWYTSSMLDLENENKIRGMPHDKEEGELHSRRQSLCKYTSPAPNRTSQFHVPPMLAQSPRWISP